MMITSRLNEGSRDKNGDKALIIGDKDQTRFEKQGGGATRNFLEIGEIVTIYQPFTDSENTPLGSNNGKTI